MSDMVLTLTINAEALKKGVVEVQGKLGELQKKKVDIDTDAAAKKLKALRESILMAGLAITGMVASVTAAIRPALEAEAALAGMEASLRNTGIYTIQLSKALQDNAAALQQVTIYEDDAILSATGLMQSIGNLSQEQLPAAQKAAIGLAAAFRIDLETAFELVGKAAAGNTSTLSRYGVVLDSSLDPAQKFAKVLELGASKFDLAEAAAKTGSGQIEQFKNSWGNMIETIGNTALPLINGILSVLKPLVETFGEMHGALKTIVVVLPLITAAYYKLIAAQVSAGVVTGSLTVAFTAAKVALQGFIATMGVPGLVLMGLTAAVTALSFAFGGAKKESDRLSESFGSMAADASRDLVKFDQLANTVLSLGQKVSRTSEETTIYKKAIGDLQSGYGPYLQNLNLEKASYQNIAAALGQVRAGLYAKMQAQLQTKALEQFEPQLMALYGLLARLKNDYKPGDMVNAMGVTMSYQAALDYLDKGIKYYQDKALAIASGIKVPAAPAGMENMGAGATASAGTTSAGADSAQAKIAAAKSELEKLKAELEAYFQDADAKLLAEYQKRSAVIMANTAAESEEQKALLTQLGDWKKAEEDKLNAERVSKLQGWLDAEIQERNAYFDEMKFLDAGYYNWKVEQIRTEVEAMGLSGDRQEALVKKRISELDAEKAAWDALPLEDVKNRYQAFKQEMASGKDIGIQSWKSILDGLLAFRAELLKLGDTPGVAEILKQLDSEIDVAQMNAGKRQSYFWSNIMGFDPDSASDKEKISRVKETFKTMQTDVTNILSGLQSLNTSRRDQELAAIDAIAAKDGINDAEAIRRKEAVTKKYAQEAKKIGAIQKAMSITQATIHTAEAAVAAYKAMAAIPVVGPVLAVAASAAAIAAGAVQIAIIKAQKFASGGYFLGQGGPKDDQNLVALSNGEFVINAESTKRYRPLLEQINDDGLSPNLSLSMLDRRFLFNIGEDMQYHLRPYAWTPNTIGKYANGGLITGGIPLSGTGQSSSLFQKMIDKIDLVNLNLASLDLAVTVVNHAPDVKTQVERHEIEKARQIARGKDFSYGRI